MRGYYFRFLSDIYTEPHLRKSLTKLLCRNEAATSSLSRVLIGRKWVYKIPILFVVLNGSSYLNEAVLKKPESNMLDDEYHSSLSRMFPFRCEVSWHFAEIAGL